MSRILGFFRDMNTAAVMGMSGSIIMDAFVLAFRIPNEVKRLCEDGTLQLSFIPVFTPLWIKDRKEATKLFGVTLIVLSLFLLLIVILGEAFCVLAIWIVDSITNNSESLYRFALLTFMYLLPFLLFFPLSMFLTAALQGMERFAFVAFIPMLFNIFWLAALLFISPFGLYLPFRIESLHLLFFGFDLCQLNLIHQAVFLSLAIVSGSIFQFVIQMLYLYWLGIRVRLADFRIIKDALQIFFFAPRNQKQTLTLFADFLTQNINNSLIIHNLIKIVRILFPSVCILFLIQINVLLATIIAILFSGEPGTSISWLRLFPGLKDWLTYPMTVGATSALYFSERLYEFPLGMIGVTVGTVFYPLINKHARLKNHKELASDIQWAVRLVLAMSIPATVGLIFLAEPLSRLLYEHGEFSADDALRTSHIISCFALGICAFCLIPIMIRCYFVVRDYRTPIFISFRNIIFFLFLAMFLIWPQAEKGLAISFSLAAWLQVLELFWIFYRKHETIKLFPIFKTIMKSGIATILMGEILWLIFQGYTEIDTMTDLKRIGCGLFVGIIIFGLAYFLLENKIQKE